MPSLTPVIAKTADHIAGRVLLERLPVEEWSARSYHETAVAQRVATLRSMYEVYEKTRKSSAANQHPLVMPPEWIDEARAAAAEGGPPLPHLLGTRPLSAVAPPRRTLHV